MRSSRMARAALGILVGAGVLAPERVEGARIDVRPGPGTPLTAALARAAAYDTVFVHRGVYREPVLSVTVPMTLLGEPGAVLDGAGAHPVLVVRASHVTVRDLTLRHTGFSGIDDRAAIRFVDVSDCRVIGNRIEEAFFGIYLARVTGCEVRDNVIRGTSGGEMDAGNGIHLWYTRDVQISGNTIEHHRDGIYFEFTHGGVVRNNLSRRNARYGLHFMFSDSCRYLANTFTDNSAGIAVMYTKFIEIRDNVFANAVGSASYGLLLKAISDSRIENNTFRGNSVGLHLEEANRNQIIGNRIERNGWAMRIMANADDNVVTGNTFAANAFDVVANGDRSSTRMSHNFWDAYRGYDLNRDGIGDVPHHPVRFFALIVENNPPTLLLLRSFLLDVLDLAERVLPVLTPATVVDTAPLMRRPS